MRNLTWFVLGLLAGHLATWAGATYSHMWSPGPYHITSPQELWVAYLGFAFMLVLDYLPRWGNRYK